MGLFFVVLVAYFFGHSWVVSFGNYTVGQSKESPITFWDAMYFNLVTVTTIGYGEIVPIWREYFIFYWLSLLPLTIGAQYFYSFLYGAFLNVMAFKRAEVAIEPELEPEAEPDRA